MEVLKTLLADIIYIQTKLNCKYIQILYLKDFFPKFSMLYALKSKKASEIAYYIGFFVRHLGILESLYCDNVWEFKGALLVFLKKYNIKLINGRFRTLRIQELVKQTNTMVKDKFRKEQVANGTGAQADILIEICETINNQTHEFLFTDITFSQLMFLYKSKIRNIFLTSATTEEKSVLRQLSVNNINKECKTVATKKRKAIVLASHHLFEKAPDLIQIEEGKNKENSDSKNSLQFQ